ncbi:hypothetical protein [Nonomuraea sp. NPDC052265]
MRFVAMSSTAKDCPPPPPAADPRGRQAAAVAKLTALSPAISAKLA